MDKEILAIDDLGTEPREIIEYGNVLSPIIDLISYRYEHQLPTIITSNLTPQQISEVYGKRIGDRLKETTEIVPFLNGSYRGEETIIVHKCQANAQCAPHIRCTKSTGFFSFSTSLLSSILGVSRLIAFGEQALADFSH